MYRAGAHRDSSSPLCIRVHEGSADKGRTTEGRTTEGRKTVDRTLRLETLSNVRKCRERMLEVGGNVRKT